MEFRNVSKRYPRARAAAIEDLSLTVGAGEVCVLVGPSGSGKTTAMRLINRLIPLSGGDILLGGRSVLDRGEVELRREIGYVIQQIGLFPHHTVAENIATVPRLLGWTRERIAQRTRELLELIGMDPEEIGPRYPAALSGGQRQRVGVARALAADPPLLLMDEPFGAIDPINRARLQDEFLALQARVRKTVVFVTHDIDEAIKMGDRVAVLRQGGTLAQYATPGELLVRAGRMISSPRSSAPTAGSSGSGSRRWPTSRSPPAPRNAGRVVRERRSSARPGLDDAARRPLDPAARAAGFRSSCSTLRSREGAVHAGSGRRRPARRRRRRRMLIAAAPVIPNFGGSAYACERANRSLCFDWISRNWDGVLWPALREHILLTVAAVAIGFAISAVLAIAAHRRRALERPIVAVTLSSTRSPRSPCSSCWSRSAGSG